MAEGCELRTKRINSCNVTGKDTLPGREDGWTKIVLTWNSVYHKRPIGRPLDRLDVNIKNTTATSVLW